MTGIILLSRDGFYADKEGGVSWGPKSDKAWVKEFIKDKIVFVGYNTWETIKDFEQLTLLPKEWRFGEPGEGCQVHFGGPKSFQEFQPDRMIVHKTRTDLLEGLKYECPCKWKLLSHRQFPDYSETIYAKRR